MYKIFKSNEIKEIEKKISIPDKKIEPQKKAKVNVDVECNSEEAKKLFDSIIEEAQEEADRIFESTSSLLETKRHAIISDAKEDAIQIKNSAELEANSIIEKAKAEAISIKENAYLEGLQEGINQKSEAVDKIISDIEKKIKELYISEKNYFEKYANELKSLSIEIAEKVIYSKISENELVLNNLVKTTMKMIKDAKWVTIEISSKLPDLAKSLEKEMLKGDLAKKLEIHLLEDYDEGTVVIQSPDRLIDASVKTQIHNIKDSLGETLNEKYNT